MEIKIKVPFTKKHLLFRHYWWGTELLYGICYDDGGYRGDCFYIIEFINHKKINDRNR